jgi:hypothetical protein
MTGSRLRTQCVSMPEKTVLVTCFRVDQELGQQLIGHAFASVWDYGVSGGMYDCIPMVLYKAHIVSGDPTSNTSVVVGWITQLVVDKTVRQRYIATQLLQVLKAHPLFTSISIIGLVSSHPAACNALAKYAGKSILPLSTRLSQLMVSQAANIYSVDLDFIRDNAAGILAASDIQYLKDAKLSGKLFQEDNDSGAVSSVFTEFYVDHDEPLEVLEQYKAKGQWCLGELLDGHEFLAIFPVMTSSPIGL